MVCVTTFWQHVLVILVGLDLVVKLRTVVDRPHFVLDAVFVITQLKLQFV